MRRRTIKTARSDSQGAIARITNFDKFLSQKLTLSNLSQRNGLCLVVCRLLEWSGHGELWLAFGILLTLLSKRNGYYESHDRFAAGGILLSALVMDLVVIVILKITARRKRPHYNDASTQMVLVSADEFSFPSGHTTRAFMLLGLYITWFDIHSMATLVCVVGWACSLALSRVMLGRHHVLDVGVGIIVGLTEALMFNYLYAKMPNYKDCKTLQRMLPSP